MEDVPGPRIQEPTDAVVRLAATCICGSDLWPYRGADEVSEPLRMGHECCGVVEEVGADVHDVEVGDFVVGSFFASDNTCETCRAGYQTSCVHQALGREFGATDVVTERGEEGIARVKELTGGLGAHSVVEAVGTHESMHQAIGSTRPGGHVGFVGVLHDVAITGEDVFTTHVHLHGGPAPVRRFLPELIDLIWTRRIDPGRVFDLTLPLERAAEGYEAVHERRATKVLLQP